MSSFSAFRDIFWPLIDKEESEVKDLNPFLEKCDTIKEGDEEKVLAQAIKCIEEENDRRKTIETKASLFVSVITVSTTLVLSYTKQFIDIVDLNFFGWLQLTLLTILTLYLVRTIWFSVKTLERKVYKCLDVTDFIDFYICPQSKKQLIKEIIKVIETNEKATNQKVDCMVLAHMYFKRAAFILGLYALIVFIYKVLTILLDKICWC